MGYGAIHRFFLRTIASQGVLTISGAQDILKSFPDTEKIPVEELIKEINNKIRQFQQTIKTVIDEVTNETKLVFLSLACDDATKSQNVFTPKELDFFRVLIEEIMTTDSRQLTSQCALNLVHKLKLSKTEAEKLLNMWCRMYYLVEINSNYALGIRGIHEFENYLRENMPDTIHECCLCKKIVFRGYNCPPCGEAVHSRCLDQYLQNGPKWPCCQAKFNSAQLDVLNKGLSQTQTTLINDTQATQRLDSIEELPSDDEYVSEVTIPGISLTIRKRKRLTRTD